MRLIRPRPGGPARAESKAGRVVPAVLASAVWLAGTATYELLAHRHNLGQAGLGWLWVGVLPCAISAVFDAVRWRRARRRQ